MAIDRSIQALEQAENDESSRHAEFMRLLSGVYQDVYSAALVIVGNRADADDVLQEVCIVLWEKYGEVEPILNFRKWACTVAFYVAKNFVRKHRRRHLRLSNYAMTRVEQVHSAGAELFELRRELLDNCLSRMKPEDRAFLEECYDNSSTLVERARSSRTPVETLYTRLKRLRQRLTDCVNRTLGKGR